MVAFLFFLYQMIASFSSLSFYLSMGVVEHFKEGTMDALSEAYSVLKPGGCQNTVFYSVLKPGGAQTPYFTVF